MSDDGSVDFAALAERAKHMRRRLERARDDMVGLQAEGFGGGGLVRATVNGENTLVALDIDSSIIDPDDPETLGALVREAVNDAIGKLGARRGERVAGIVEGLGGMFSDARREPPGVRPLTADRRPLPAAGRLPPAAPRS